MTYEELDDKWGWSWRTTVTVHSYRTGCTLKVSEQIGSYYCTEIECFYN